MERAYVLINCDLGTEKFVIDEIKNLTNVREVYGTWGPYDVIATVESNKPEKVTQTVIGKIRKLDHIRSTCTLIETEEGAKKDMMKAELIPDIIPEEKKPLEPPSGMDEEFDQEDNDEDYDDKDYSTKKKKHYTDVYKKRYREK